MAAITLHVLKPSVNNLTVRIFVRAAGLDFEEIDVWGKTRRAGVPRQGSRAPDADDRGVGPAARLALGELRDHAVPVQQARARPASTRRPGRARDGRQRDVLRHRHALSADDARDVSGARLPAVPRRGRLLGRRRRRRRRRRSRPRSTRSPSRSTSTAPSSSTAGTSSAATSPSIADIRLAASLEFLNAVDYEFPAWAREYMAAMESSLGDAYSEPAADVRGYIAYVKSQND